MRKVSNRDKVAAKKHNDRKADRRMKRDDKRGYSNEHEDNDND